MWQTHDGMGWWMVFSAMLWLAFWALALYLVVSLVSRARPPRDELVSTAATDEALSIARRRYAAGEIDRDEFVRLSEDLAERARHPGPA